MPIKALVVGGSGIAGRGISQELVDHGHAVHGLSRHAEGLVDGVKPVTADIFDAPRLRAALAGVAPTHVYFSTWSRRSSEALNIEANSAMVRNVLDALAPAKSVRHVALVTGLKHYLGPFDAYASSGTLPETPFREEQPRLDIPNFYYAQEDEVYAAARRDGFTWSIHRPHTIVGRAVGNAMNMGSTLAVYASLCKELGRPFRWPGSAAQWNGLSDVTDARILGKQLVWASTHDDVRDEAFNIVNGDVFRWKWLWPRLAKWFGVESVGFEGSLKPLEEEMAGDGPAWTALARKDGLREGDLGRLASPWHTDLDLSRPLEVMTDMGKSRKAGFNVFQGTEDSFLHVFAAMRADRLIP
jgi:nucleoside-diphosphate-sugar epimerase